LDGSDAVDVTHELDGHVALELVVDAAGDTDDSASRGHSEVAPVEAAVDGQLTLDFARDVRVVGRLRHLHEVGDAGVAEGLGEAAGGGGTLGVFRATAKDENPADFDGLETINSDTAVDKEFGDVTSVRLSGLRRRYGEGDRESGDGEEAADCPFHFYLLLLRLL